MKFPRHARIFRGQLDAAPFAIVFFLLVIFLMLASLVYTPGVRLQLPIANDLPGPEKRTVAVAIDASGRLYFENKLIDENQLRVRLRRAVQDSAQPLALVLQADQAATDGMLVRLTLLAREAGVGEAWLATLPRPLASPPPPPAP